MKSFMRRLAEPLLMRYLAATHLMKAREAGLITPEALPYCERVARRCVIVDCLYNLTWAVLHFREFPRELLVTQRLERYKYGRAYRIVLRGWKPGVEEISVPPAVGWRLEETLWLETNLLDPFDPSRQHLRPPRTR